MFVELHILQNFAPSNLNRDDTGAPKDCEFGGYRRARISSQCLKRAVRDHFEAQRLIPTENLADRTKRVVEHLMMRLSDTGKSAEEARVVVETALRGAGLGVKDDGKTEYLLFLGRREMQSLEGLCLEHWHALLSAGKGQESGGKSGKEAKKAGKAALSGELATRLKNVLDGGKAIDLALFGRMLADLPERNVDAACQVAHAISTNRVSMEFDYYTAVDDLKRDDTPGADMLGTVEFNSACFYRYANVDCEQLAINLDGDVELTQLALDAFLRAAVDAVPTGKQNSMAAHNPPSLVLAVARRAGLWSLANAFVQPIRPMGNADLVCASVAALDDYWGRLIKMYGQAGIVGAWVATLNAESLQHLAPFKEPAMHALVAKVVHAVGSASVEVGVA